ncbi:hypothetical protein ACJJTC_008562 [Scirpophaga incertulas]
MPIASRRAPGSTAKSAAIKIRVLISWGSHVNEHWERCPALIEANGVDCDQISVTWEIGLNCEKYTANATSCHFAVTFGAANGEMSSQVCNVWRGPRSAMLRSGPMRDKR